MRKGIFSEERMVGILREADRDPVAQVAKRHGVSEQMIHTWRQRFSGMNADDVKKLRQLEQENARLKKLPAERDLVIEAMRKSSQKNGRGARRQQAAFTQKRELSQRRACTPYSSSRSTCVAFRA